jgi:anaerobic ribonucleoside-triphosphate reductase
MNVSKVSTATGISGSKTMAVCTEVMKSRPMCLPLHISLKLFLHIYLKFSNHSVYMNARAMNVSKVSTATGISGLKTMAVYTEVMKSRPMCLPRYISLQLFLHIYFKFSNCSVYMNARAMNVSKVSTATDISGLKTMAVCTEVMKSRPMCLPLHISLKFLLHIYFKFSNHSVYMNAGSFNLH